MGQTIQSQARIPPPLSSVYVICTVEYNTISCKDPSLHDWHLLCAAAQRSAQRSAFINSMTSNHSDRPILRRILTTTHQQDSAGSTSNTTPASFHGCSSIITHVQSRWIVVDESPGGASDGSDIKEGSQIEEIESAEDIPANDDDSPIHRTYQFDNCHVYINSFNARGVKVDNSGNYAPRVTRMSRSLLQFSCKYP